jgi:hypothetical protein
MTQPSAEDNIFLFYSFFYALGAVFFVQFVYRMFKAKHADETKGIILGAAIVIVLSSSISVLMGLRVILTWVDCWRKTEVETAKWIRANTPRDAVFLYQPAILHFISALTGRQSYAGAPNVLSKEGFDWEHRWQELNNWVGRLSEADVPFQFILKNKDTPRDMFGKINDSRWTKIYKGNRFMVYQKTEM